MRVLFLGNSFTSGFDVPRQVQLLVDELQRGSADGTDFEYDTVLRGGAALARWANDKQGLVADRLARGGKGGNFDFVVLQEQSNKPWKNKPKFHEAAKELHRKFRDVGTVAVLYQTTPWRDWTGRDQERALLDSYREIHRDLLGAAADGDGSEVRKGVCLLAPVGEAARMLRERHPQIDLWEKDGRHPSLQVAFLAACVLAGTLTGRSLSGLALPVETVPPGKDRGKLGWDRLGEEEVKMITAVADEILKPKKDESKKKKDVVKRVRRNESMVGRKRRRVRGR